MKILSFILAFVLMGVMIYYGYETQHEAYLFYGSLGLLVIIFIQAHLLNRWRKKNKKLEDEAYKWRVQRNEFEAKASDCRHNLIEVVNNPDSIWSKRIKESLKGAIK